MATDATQAAGRVADDTNGVDIQLRRELPSFTITVEGPRQQCFTFRYDDFATVLTLRLALCKKLGAEHNDIIVHLRSGSITTSLTDQHSLNNFQMLPAEHRRVHVNISNAAVRQRWDEEFSTPSVGKSDDKAVLNGGRREFACSYGQQSRERYAEGSATIKRSKLQSCTSENDTHLNGAPERVTLRGDAQMDNDGAQQQGSRQPQSVTSIENREWDSGSEVGIPRDRSPRPSTHAVIQPGSKAAVKERTAKHLTSMKAKVTQRPRRSKARRNATLTVIPTNNGELRLHRHRSTPTACNNPDFKTAAAFERFLGPISGDPDTLYTDGLKLLCCNPGRRASPVDENIKKVQGSPVEYGQHLIKNEVVHIAILTERRRSDQKLNSRPYQLTTVS